MQQKNPAGNFFSDMQSTMKQMLDAAPAANPFDLKTVLEAQRKNMQALTEANQCAMNGWQALAKRQAEMVSKFVQNNSGLASQTFSAAAPQDTLAKQTEILKTVCEESLENAREIAEILRKNTAEAAEIVNRRVMAGIAEIKSSAVEKTDE
jgi:phasin family protein